MEQDVYERMNQLEAKHWWFVARRKIIAAVITRFAALDGAANILEAGVGTGGNIAMLQKFGDVHGFEYDESARANANAKTGLPVAYGALPDDVPFHESKFDLICLLDVLEHIEQDAKSLAALSTRLAPTGKILVTVPAYPWLWSQHDVNHHHFRRYTRTTLKIAAKQAGLSVDRISNFNMLLLPLILSVRVLKRLSRSTVSDDKMPGPVFNRLLSTIFASERYLVGRVPMPVGVSIVAVLSRNEC
ncbi:class I SAM-dependent methyltransferase [Cognatishimia activa]|uniref:Methyltransferase domain protein n=1 Tax=Cognatishimia activa TaxID=1715691 RepID=A0A0P1IVF3_9RHOB|nr:class I SAM-dependent methyltransferase [Cognatishimia activa]CUJ17765.1 Methyltransferase domain protein [Cognatishimia activa]CUK27572.1 Methyltransferase domain protein [Cognatishimia activa]